MLSGIYILTLFHSVRSGAAIISSFTHGYGKVSDEQAFRIAVDFGTYLVLWPSRQPENSDDQLIEKCVVTGKDIIVHAEGRNKLWFRGGVLHGLFDFIQSHSDDTTV
jgi:hypothetical protein